MECSKLCLAVLLALVSCASGEWTVRLPAGMFYSKVLHRGFVYILCVIDHCNKCKYYNTIVMICNIKSVHMPHRAITFIVCCKSTVLCMQTGTTLYKYYLLPSDQIVGMMELSYQPTL